MAGKRTVCLTLSGWCLSSRVSLAFGSYAWVSVVDFGSTPSTCYPGQNDGPS
jgi:hypothetical protein